MRVRKKATGDFQEKIETEARKVDNTLRTVYDNKAPALRRAFPILGGWDVADMRFFGMYDRSLAQQHGIDYGLVAVERIEEVLSLGCDLDKVEALFQGASKEALKDGFSFYFSRQQPAAWSSDCYRCRATMPMLYKRLVRRPLPLLHPDVVRYFADFLLLGEKHGWRMNCPDRHPHLVLLDREAFLTELKYTERQREEFVRLLADNPRYSPLTKG